MKTFLTTVAGVFVGLTLFALAAPIVLIALVSAATRPAPTPARAVLSLDLRGGLTDQAPTGALAFLGGKTQSVMSIEEALRRVPLIVALGERLDASARLAHFVLPDHHALESFGDLQPRRGVRQLQQPALAPLWDTRAS